MLKGQKKTVTKKVHHVKKFTREELLELKESDKLVDEEEVIGTAEFDDIEAALIDDIDYKQILEQRQKNRNYIIKIKSNPILYSEFIKKKAKYYEKNKEKIKQQKAEYYKKNKDEIKQQKAEYYKNNKDEVKQRRAEYYEKNKDEIKQQKAEYYEKNKDEIKQQKAEYYEKNKEKIKQKAAEYRQKKKGEIKQ